MKTSTNTLKRKPFSPVTHPEERKIWAKKAVQEKVKTHDAAFVEELIRFKAEKAKKSQSLQLLFKSIGLCLSLLLVLAAFELKFYDKIDDKQIGNSNAFVDDFVDIPVTQQLPPEPVVQQPQIVEVANEEEIVEEIKFTLDIQATEETKIVAPVQSEFMTHKPEEEKPEEIFTIVENQPEPKGGYKTFYEFVGNNLKYPQRAINSTIEGIVYVQFVVEKDGSLTDIQVVRGIGFGCDEEATRVLSIAPKWSAGKQRGNPVRVRMILPIHFKIIQR